MWDLSWNIFQVTGDIHAYLLYKASKDILGTEDQLEGKGDGSALGKRDFHAGKDRGHCDSHA